MLRLRRQFSKVNDTSCSSKFVNDMMHRSIEVFNEKCQTFLIDLSIMLKDCLSIIFCPRDCQRLISLTLLKENYVRNDGKRKSLKTKNSKNICAASETSINCHKFSRKKLNCERNYGRISKNPEVISYCKLNEKKLKFYEGPKSGGNESDFFVLGDLLNHEASKYFNWKLLWVYV